MHTQTTQGVMQGLSLQRLLYVSRDHLCTGLGSLCLILIPTQGSGTLAGLLEFLCHPGAFFGRLQCRGSHRQRLISHETHSDIQ